MNTSDHPDRVVDDVHALAAGDLHDLLLPVWLGVVNDVVCTAVLRADVELLSGACRGDDLRSEGYGRVNIGGYRCRSRDLPLPSCTAEEPTPPAAARTRSHSPEDV